MNKEKTKCPKEVLLLLCSYGRNDGLWSYVDALCLLSH